MADWRDRDDIIPIPLADYRVLLRLAEDSEDFLRCGTCNAWMSRDEAHPSLDEWGVVGCDMAVAGTNPGGCARYRLELDAGGPLPPRRERIAPPQAVSITRPNDPRAARSARLAAIMAGVSVEISAEDANHALAALSQRQVSGDAQ